MQSVWTPSSWHDYVPTFRAIFSCHVHVSMRFGLAMRHCHWGMWKHITLCGPTLKQKQCGFLCLFVWLFVWSLVCLCVLLFSFVCFLVSLFYDDRWYLCISNSYIAGSVVKTKTMWVSLFVRLFICVVTCLFVCLTFFICLFFSFFVLWWSMILMH